MYIMKVNKLCSTLIKQQMTWTLNLLCIEKGLLRQKVIVAIKCKETDKKEISYRILIGVHLLLFTISPAAEFKTRLPPQPSLTTGLPS